MTITNSYQHVFRIATVTQFTSPFDPRWASGWCCTEKERCSWNSALKRNLSIFPFLLLPFNFVFFFFLSQSGKPIKIVRLLPCSNTCHFTYKRAHVSILSVVWACAFFLLCVYRFSSCLMVFHWACEAFWLKCFWEFVWFLSFYPLNVHVTSDN